jgi:hypothetical protein
MSAGRATASGHRAVLKHEAIWLGCVVRPNGERDDEGEQDPHQHAVPLRHSPCDFHGCVVLGDEIDIVPTVEANGSKPISPLSVAAEPRCVS